VQTPVLASVLRAGSINRTTARLPSPDAYGLGVATPVPESYPRALRGVAGCDFLDDPDDARAAGRSPPTVTLNHSERHIVPKAFNADLRFTKAPVSSRVRIFFMFN